MRHSVSIWTALFLASASVGVGQVGVGGPVMGAIEDARTRSIRPIFGLPGGALLGPPVPMSSAIEKIHISHVASFAVVVAQDTGAVQLVRWSADGTATIVPLDGVMTNPSALFMSDSGASVLLVGGAQSTVQVVSSLPDQPQVGKVMALGDQLGKLECGSVKDDGSEILLTVPGEPGSMKLYRVPMAGDNPGTPLFAAQFVKVAALHYVNSDKDAVIADAGANVVALVQDVDSAAAVRQLAGESDGIAHPIGVSATADGTRMIVVNGDDSTARVVDMGSGQIGDAIPLLVKPSRCDRLANGTAFVVNRTTDGLLQVVDLGLSAPWAYFVPLN